MKINTQDHSKIKCQKSRQRVENIAFGQNNKYTHQYFSPSKIHWANFPSSKNHTSFFGRRDESATYCFIHISFQFAAEQARKTFYICIYIYIYTYIKHFATKMVSEAKTVKEDRSRTQVAFLKKQKKGQVNFIDFGQVKNLNIKKTNCNHPGTTGQI